VFIHALRQDTARKLKQPIAGLKLSTGDSANAVQLKNMWLEGCDLDVNTDALAPSGPSAAIRMQMPAVKVAWVPDRSAELGSFAKSGMCLPVYADSQRMHLVCELNFHSDDPRTLILNSAAAFLDN
jgi:hypothetical protein